MGSEDYLHEVSPEEVETPEKPMTLERVLNQVLSEKGKIRKKITDLERQLRQLRESYEEVKDAETMLTNLSIQQASSAEIISAVSAEKFIMDPANRARLEEKTENMRVLEPLLTKTAWRSLCKHFPRLGDILVCEIKDFTQTLRGFGDSAARNFVQGLVKHLGVLLPVNAHQAQAAKAVLEQVRAEAGK